MKILIKGGGDLATGIAYRLKMSGYDILITEIEIPTTVRRTVAFSRAVYEGESIVEGLRSILIYGQGDIATAWDEGNIPVLIDRAAESVSWYQPDVIVDAILAKKNLGTGKQDAGLVIGVGPGFIADVDCHCVVETKRGHYLGKTIYNGCAIPNTGIPGNIGGYTTERIIRANGNGIFMPMAEIGDYVEQGQKVAEIKYSEQIEPVSVYAGISGIVRGLLQQGVIVSAGMKAGDIDARCKREHCFNISDKARSIGGGVLEAVVSYEHRLFVKNPEK